MLKEQFHTHVFTKLELPETSEVRGVVNGR
jgi:hypothetical protein